MVQAIKDRSGTPRPRGSTPAPEELVALAEGLRDVMIIARRKAAGSAHDKSVVMLLSHLMTLGPLRASDLSERACLDLSTVSRHLSALEADGYVTRTPDPDDGRAQLLSVTPSGEKLVKEVARATSRHARAGTRRLVGRRPRRTHPPHPPPGGRPGDLVTAASPAGTGSSAVGTPENAAAVAEPATRHLYWALAALMLTMLLAALDQTIVSMSAASTPVQPLHACQVPTAESLVSGKHWSQALPGASAERRVRRMSSQRSASDQPSSACADVAKALLAHQA